MEKDFKTVVFEQSGKLSQKKMSWLAELIVAYSNAHPELLEEFEKEQKKKLSADNGEQ